MHLDEYMKTIDVPKFEAVLRQLAAENPDFRYVEPGTVDVSCRYDGPAKDDDGKVVGNPCSGCIFGQAFQREGVTQGLDSGSTIYSITENLNDSTRDNWFELQQCQDNGETWGEAIKQLDKQGEKDDA